MWRIKCTSCKICLKCLWIHMIKVYLLKVSSCDNMFLKPTFIIMIIIIKSCCLLFGIFLHFILGHGCCKSLSDWQVYVCQVIYCDLVFTIYEKERIQMPVAIKKKWCYIFGKITIMNNNSLLHRHTFNILIYFFYFSAWWSVSLTMPDTPAPHF